MNVDYAPNGWAAYSDGSPVEIRLTLQFKELDIVTKEAIDPRRDATYSGGEAAIAQAVSNVIPSFDKAFPNLK